MKILCPSVPLVTKTVPSAESYRMVNAVAMWDAIDNEDFGIHSDSASVWKDLTGNGNDAYLLAGTASSVWGQDYMQVKTGSGVWGLAAARTSRLLFGTGTIPDLTFEAVFTPTGFVSDSAVLSCIEASGFGIKCEGGTDRYRAMVYRDTVGYYNHDPIEVPVGTTVSLACVYSASSGYAAFYRNGTVVTSLTSVPKPVRETYPLYLGAECCGNNYSNAANMKIRTLRVHAGRLYPDDLARNLAIDRARFHF